MKQLNLDFLEGEQVMLPPIEDVEHLDYMIRKRVKGSLILTNFQLYFACFDTIFQKWVYISDVITDILGIKSESPLRDHVVH